MMPEPPEQIPFMQKVKQTESLIPVVLLIAGVIGSLYVGIASPTDAAAVGVFLSLLLTWCNGNLNWSISGGQLSPRQW